MQLRGIPLNDVKELNRIRDGLNDVYAKVPSTKGCMENIHKQEGACEAWCCEVQNPQVLYSEFVNTWRTVVAEWQSLALVELVGAAIRNFLDNRPTKGCVFWDKRSRMCDQHKTRPLSCRTYGLMPEDEWKPRYEKLKVVYPEGDFRMQCSLVSTEDGSTVSKSDTDRWWHSLIEVEKSLGIPASKITDAPGGTYRTYHDHIMLGMYGENPAMLTALSKLRVNGTEQQKEALIHDVMSLLQQRVGEASQSGHPSPEGSEEIHPSHGSDGGGSEGSREASQDSRQEEDQA